MTSEQHGQQFIDDIEEIRVKALYEFMDATDYLWKAPRFLDDQVRIERKKLDIYFPENGNELTQELRKSRWRAETTAISTTFRHLQTKGNLIAIVSLFESYVASIARAAHGRGGLSLDDVRENGPKRYYTYVRRCFSDEGKDVEHLTHWQVMQAAIKFRNLLAHASGVLIWSKEREEINRLVKSRSYLLRQYRNNERDNDASSVTIRPSIHGEQLHMGNHYPWQVSTYASKLIQDICIVLTGGVPEDLM